MNINITNHVNNEELRMQVKILGNHKMHKLLRGLTKKSIIYKR